MTESIIRKAAAVVAVAFLASSTLAMAQATRLRLPPGQTHTYTAHVVAGVPATVAIRGDEDADFDIFVYNRFGQLVAVDDDDMDCCVVRWVPLTSGSVRFAWSTPVGSPAATSSSAARQGATGYLTRGAMAGVNSVIRRASVPTLKLDGERSGCPSATRSTRHLPALSRDTRSLAVGRASSVVNTRLTAPSLSVS